MLNNLPPEQWQGQTDTLLTTTFRDALPPHFENIDNFSSYIATWQTLGWVGTNLTFSLQDTSSLFPADSLEHSTFAKLTTFFVSRHNLSASITTFENCYNSLLCLCHSLESKCLMTKDQILVTFLLYLTFNNYPLKFICLFNYAHYSKPSSNTFFLFPVQRYP